MDGSELLRRYAAGERNFSRADLYGANLRQAYLREASLSGTDFREADLFGADLGGADLRGAYLGRTNLIGANLREADLFGADLGGADLRGAYLGRANLIGANLTGAKLYEANLYRANLYEAKLYEANLHGANLYEANLYGANLAGAELYEANLYGANLAGAELYEANLIGANLIGANLCRVQLLKAQLNKAKLTGVCIEDWHTNSETNLDGVLCDYVYLKYDDREKDREKCFKERRPHDPNKIFAPGEFTQLFQKALETVDLIFSDGIDWTAFLTSFQGLQIEYEESELSIQAIEKKRDGAFVVRVDVPAEANKAAIEATFRHKYEVELKQLEATYRAKLQAKEEQIEIYKQKSADIFELAKLASSRPITVEAKAVAEQKSLSQDFRHASISGGVAGTNSGTMQGGDIHNYAPAQKQSLAEAADEIQQLLKQLEQTNPTATEAEQIAHVNDETTPKFKRRAVSALKAGKDAAIEELVENSYAKIVLAILNGWLDAE